MERQRNGETEKRRDRETHMYIMWFYILAVIINRGALEASASGSSPVFGGMAPAPGRAARARSPEPLIQLIIIIIIIIVITIIC